MNNPVTELKKLIKTKEALDQFNKEKSSMFKNGWKSGILGVIVLAIGLAKIWAPQPYQDKVQQTQDVLTKVGLLGVGGGLLFTKDYDK